MNFNQLFRIQIFCFHILEENNVIPLRSGKLLVVILLPLIKKNERSV